jgi:glycosyltransferase involved in cell wall biosynthesis
MGGIEMDRPLVSVIVSAYNRPAMLRDAIASVQSQTYEDLEILVQDDSTNDDCKQIVQGLLDARIHYSSNRPSLGTSLNLLAGYKKSRGKYFCTLNDDDLYDPEYIETMVAALEGDPRYSLAFSDSYIIDEEGNVKEDATEENTRTSHRARLREGSVDDSLKVGIVSKSIPAMLAVFRRDAVDLDDFPPEVSSGYDYWLAYLAVRDGNPIYYTPNRLTYYRVHRGSQTSGFSGPEERLRFSSYSQYIHERFLADPRLIALRPMLYPRLAEAHSSAGFSWMRLSSRSQALQEFITSCRLKPNLSALAGILLCGLPRFALRFVFNRPQ